MSKNYVKILSFIIVFMLSIMLYNNTAYSEETPPEPHDYCDDQIQWQEWRNLVENHPDDDPLAIGYALRIGLCQQIKNHTIDTERAIALFDRYMNALKDETAMQERRAKRLETKGNI